MNGTNGISSVKNGVVRSGTDAWETLSRWLPARGPDQDFWWNFSGRHLAAMLEAAGYTPEKQYEALLIFYHWNVPYLGPAPGPSGKAPWNSLLTVDGTPIEYSWKWNTPTGEPDVRFTMEPMSKHTGTALDPLNQFASRELMHHISQRQSTVDLSWVDYFLSTFFDHDRTEYIKEAQAGAHLVSSVSVAFEFIRKGLNLKTYFAPRKLGRSGLMPLEQWEECIRRLDPKNKALALVDDFVATSAEGKKLVPFMLAVDNVKEASRVKFYFQTPNTSFASVREIMTMGGRLTGLENQLSQMRSLINAVSGLPEDFAEESAIPVSADYHPVAEDNFVDRPDLLEGYMYYFDIAPGAEKPDIKFYTPVRRYGRNDANLARGLTGWMKAHGRGAYCDQYMKMLEVVAEHRKLEEDQGVQTYVSCLFKKSGDLDITTYLAPEAYHPVRMLAKQKAAAATA